MKMFAIVLCRGLNDQKGNVWESATPECVVKGAYLYCHCIYIFQGAILDLCLN